MGRPKGAKNKNTLKRTLAEVEKTEKEQQDKLLIENYKQSLINTPDLIDPKIKDAIIKTYLAANPLPQQQNIIAEYSENIINGKETIGTPLKDFIINKYKFEKNVGTKEEILEALPKDEILFKVPEPILLAIKDKLPQIREKYPCNSYQEFMEILMTTSLTLFLKTI